jgi:hypothetical protein
MLTERKAVNPLESRWGNRTHLIFCKKGPGTFRRSRAATRTIAPEVGMVFESASKPQKIVMARLGAATHLKSQLGCHGRPTSLAMTILMK